MESPSAGVLENMPLHDWSAKVGQEAEGSAPGQPQPAAPCSVHAAGWEGKGSEPHCGPRQRDLTWIQFIAGCAMMH